MAEDELLQMLAKEADRRVPAVKRGLAEAGASKVPDPEAVERLRVEVHGLKGAALVLGERRLGSLAKQVEAALAACEAEGVVEAGLAAKLEAAMNAFAEGAKAAAAGDPVPRSLARAESDLAGG